MVFNNYMLINNKQNNKNGMIFRDNNGNIGFNLKHGFNGGMLSHKSRQQNKNSLKNEGDTYVCGGSRVASEYLNMFEVQKAIHVKIMPWQWIDGGWVYVACVHFCFFFVSFFFTFVEFACLFVFL